MNASECTVVLYRWLTNLELECAANGEIDLDMGVQVPMETGFPGQEETANRSSASAFHQTLAANATNPRKLLARVCCA